MTSLKAIELDVFIKLTDFKNGKKKMDSHKFVIIQIVKSYKNLSFLLYVWALKDPSKYEKQTVYH